MSFTTPYRGHVENLDLVRDQQVADQAINTTLINGSLVYQDGTNGIKIAPVSGAIEGSRIRFAFGLPAAGQASNGTLGNKKVNTVKSGAIVIGKCGGAIVVGTYAQQGETVGNEGEFEQNTLDATSVATLKASLNKRVAIFLGKATPGGGQTTTVSVPADGADGDLGRFYML